MKFYSPILLLMLLTLSVFAQTSNRIKIVGKIVVEANDKEAVTVFNSSSIKGTITDAEGKFTIEVMLNDVIEISALQFKNFTIVIDEQIINSKQMTVFLVEQVNRLDEVIIMPYNLSGFIEKDIKSVKTFSPNMDAIYFGINDISAFEFGDDYNSGVKNIAVPTGVDNVIGINFISVAKLLLKPFFKKKKKYNISREDLFPSISTTNFRDYYSTKFFTESLNIPEANIEEFVVFSEKNGLDYSLLKNGKELEFLELLNNQSIFFLKSQND